MNIHFQIEKRNIYFIENVDESHELFETNLLKNPRVEINHDQSVFHLKHTTRPFRLLQISNIEGLPLFQMAVYLNRPKNIKAFTHAICPHFGNSFINQDEELFGIAMAENLLKKFEKAHFILIQAYKTNSKELDTFESSLKLNGYNTQPALGVTNTLILNIENHTVEQTLSKFQSKMRQKIKHRTRDLVDIRPIKDPNDGQAMQNLLAESFQKTKGTAPYIDFKTYIVEQNLAPNRVCCLGIYLKTKPEQLAAFVVATRNHHTIEMHSGGAANDPELKKISFGTFLDWEIIVWAHQLRAKTVDLGGITTGDSEDTLANISQYKRHFTQNEQEIGREMGKVLSPLRNAIFRVLKKL